MAQKSKAAAKPARSEGPSGKKSKVKPSEKRVKPVKTTAAAVKTSVKANGAGQTVPVAAAKVVLKPAKELKALKPKVTPVAMETATESAREAQIDRAKAALKKQTGTPASKAGPPTKSRSRKISIEISANEAASALAQKWSTLYKRAEQIESKPYNMKAQFEEKTAIMHKVLGWGYILANRNDRLEVLFKDGIKYLISNYKP
jgi:hypothetical protein